MPSPAPPAEATSPDPVADGYTACLVGTCYHAGLREPLQDFSDQFLRADDESRKLFPAAVVTGFRQIYWQVFDRVIDLRVPAGARLQLDDRLWDVRGVSVFVSDDGAQAMGASFARYVFVVTELVHPADGDSVVELGEIGPQRSEQQLVREVFGQLADLAGLAWLADLRHQYELPPLLTLQRVEASPPLRLTRCGLFAFWTFQRLLTWQLDRALAELDLRSDRAYDESMLDVLHIKQLSVNVHRYFMTQSISNNRALQDFVRQIRQRYQLQAQFARVPEVNAQIEEFLTLRSQLESNAKSTRLNRIVAITAIAGLPISLASMLLALTPDARFVKETTIVILSSDILLFLGAVALLAALLSLPLIEFRGRWRERRRRSAARQ